jgi:hypothetical protein
VEFARVYEPKPNTDLSFINCFFREESDFAKRMKLVLRELLSPEFPLIDVYYIVSTSLFREACRHSPVSQVLIDASHHRPCRRMLFAMVTAGDWIHSPFGEIQATFSYRVV